MSPPRRTLLIFGKRPLAGFAKTRLAPALGFEGAARLYAAFLDDTVAAARALEGIDAELWIPGDAQADCGLASRYPDLPIRSQCDGDLGQRLRDAFETAFSRGVDYAVAVGSDHPTLPAERLERAFRALRAAHLVLGPSRDGGYYSIGLRRYAWPAAADLFVRIPWSTPEVMRLTRERARELDLCHVELDAWYDVDSPGDLPRLRADVEPGSATAAALDALAAAVRVGGGGQE